MLNFPEMAQQLQSSQQQAMMQASPQGMAPEGITEPAPQISQDSASAALSNVPIPSL